MHHVLHGARGRVLGLQSFCKKTCIPRQHFSMFLLFSVQHGKMKFSFVIDSLQSYPIYSILNYNGFKVTIGMLYSRN